jgi:nitroreductase
MGTKGYAHNIQTFIVVVGNLDAYFDERDRHLIYIDGSLANMSFMLALETLGLGSCPINWPEIESREKLMEDFLKLNPWERPIMCIGVGYPDPEGKVAFSKKRDLSKIRSYNFDVH